MQLKPAQSLKPTVAQMISPHLLSIISPNDPDDPIAKQFVPSVAEEQLTALDMVDPVGDEDTRVGGRVHHKYPDRVLVMLNNFCASYCRFCFRRESVGPGLGTISDTELLEAVAYVRGNAQIQEVIFSGGDPLLLNPTRLMRAVGKFSEIDHVKWLRVHTRLPVISPELITDDIVDSLRIAKTVWISVHCNHPKELTLATRAAIGRLRSVGPLISQSVLLRGVNDDAETLRHLFLELASLGVKPYYLHHCDRARGISHFRVPIDSGIALMKDLRAISGLATPDYVLDLPGGYGKVPLESNQLKRLDERRWLVTDFKGNNHVYEEN